MFESILYLYTRLPVELDVVPIKYISLFTNDIETKIPEVDIVITSKSVNLKDTIRFLTQSYMYPKDYPDLSCLYNIASKHDLHFIETYLNIIRH